MQAGRRYYRPSEKRAECMQASLRACLSPVRTPDADAGGGQALDGLGDALLQLVLNRCRAQQLQLLLHLCRGPGTARTGFSTTAGGITHLC